MSTAYAEAKAMKARGSSSGRAELKRSVMMSVFCSIASLGGRFVGAIQSGKTKSGKKRRACTHNITHRVEILKAEGAKAYIERKYAKLKNEEKEKKEGK